MEATRGVSEGLQPRSEVGLCGGSQLDFHPAKTVGRSTRGAALRAGQEEFQNARQGYCGRSASPGRSIVLDARKARVLSRTESPTGSSFVDARVSATIPWTHRGPHSECDTRLAE